MKIRVEKSKEKGARENVRKAGARCREHGLWFIIGRAKKIG